jgi:thioredoxin reductase (NADPH)
VKDFLARNQIPFRWLDIEFNPEASALLEKLALDTQQLPLAVFPDGTHLAQSTPALIAARVGLRSKAEMPFYDLAIVGAGPAGLAAAVYGASEGLRTVMVESDAPGGQAGTSSRIENYLGFPAGVSGGDLARRAAAQARKFGTEILNPQTACSVRADGPYRNIRLSDGSELSCFALVIATGVSYRQLEVPGIADLSGAGVFYGSAVADAMTYRGEDVFILGAGNSAGQAAMHLSRFANSVTMILRGDDIRKTMSQYLVDQIAETPNIIIQPRTLISAAHGDGRLSSLSLQDAAGAVSTVPATALFIFIGASPRTEWLDVAIQRDQHGFVLTGPDLPRKGAQPRNWQLDRDPYLLETSIPGIFAVGDVRHGSVKRVASGVGEGAVAISFIHRYLSEV